MGLSLGILIIGSLYWEPERQQWRDSRLRADDFVDVRAPIRYGKIAVGRDNTYTMVFSRGCMPGQAKIVRCRSDVQTAADLIAEAEQLWAAERKRPTDGSISASWGSVAAMTNPEREPHAGIIDAWSRRVRRERNYGNIAQMEGEGELVSETGLLQIPWPILVVNNQAVSFDLLLATATQPTLTGTPPSYASPAAIAAAWRAAPNNRVEYFRNNVRDGIRTFEDVQIAAELEH